MYFKRDKQSMAAKRPVRQRRSGSKVSPKKKRQLFLPESSGRTSCLVMSAVPPELPEVSGRSRAQKSAVPVTQDLRRTYLPRQCPAAFSLLLPGVRSRKVQTRLPAVPRSLDCTGLRYFSRSLHFSNKNSTLAAFCQALPPPSRAAASPFAASCPAYSASLRLLP